MQKKVFVILATTLLLIPFITTADYMTTTNPLKETLKIQQPLIPPNNIFDPDLHKNGPEPGR